jgi:hypothetical protein
LRIQFDSFVVSWNSSVELATFVRIVYCRDPPNLVEHVATHVQRLGGSLPAAVLPFDPGQAPVSGDEDTLPPHPEVADPLAELLEDLRFREAIFWGRRVVAVLDRNVGRDRWATSDGRLQLARLTAARRVPVDHRR